MLFWPFPGDQASSEVKSLELQVSKVGKNMSCGMTNLITYVPRRFLKDSLPEYCHLFGTDLVV